MPLTPLNPNPDFSTDLTGWSGFGATIARIDVSSDPPPIGDTWAMEITPDGGSSTPRAFTSLITGIVPGGLYFAQAAMRCNIVRTVFLGITWYTSSDVVISTSTLTNPSIEADEWDIWEGRLTAPATAAKAQIVPNMPEFESGGIEVLDVAWAAFGEDFTSSAVTAAIEISSSVEATGDDVADTAADVAASAAGTKDASSTGTGGIAASDTSAGFKLTSGTASTSVDADSAIVGAKGSSGDGSSAMEMGASAEGRVQAEDVVFSDFPPIRARVRVYEPDGVLRGQLPVPLGWQAAFPLNDLSSMTLEYANIAAGVSILEAPCEVALELSDESGNFVEHPNCRFLNIRQGQDLIQPDVTTKLTMPSYGWMLRKIRNIDTQTFNEEGDRVFTDATVGTIINTFVTEAHTRGNTPFLVTDFSSTSDSDGEAWDDQITIAVPAGQDLWTLLQTLTSQGMCDFRMNKRVLQLYKPDTFLNRDLTTNPSAVVLHVSRDISAAPDDRSWEDIAHTILVQGDEANFATLEQSVNPSPWGEWENFMTQSGVTDVSVLENLGLRALETANAPRTQMTREVLFRSQSPLPLINYRPGDHVLSQDETAVMDDLRVRQITLNMTGEALTGNVVLGDKFIERDIRIQRQIAALNGSASTIGGSGTTPTTPTPPIEDTRVPSQVTGVALQSTSFVDQLGRPQGQFSVQWDEVTQSTGGEDQDMESYRVRWQVEGSGNLHFRTVGADTLITHVGADIEVLTTYTVQVAAVGTNGLQGAYSAAQNIFIPADDTPPTVPSTPEITSRLGTLRVHWDGLDEDGLPMPVDLAHVTVEMGNTGSGPFAQIGTVPSSTADLIVADQPYNSERFFRLRAVDTSGNTSGYSDVASGTVTPLVDTDIIGEIIDGANIVDGSIVASDKVIANTITGGLIQALAINAGHIQANAITSDKIEAGAVTAEKVQAYSIDATRIAIGGGRNLVVDGNARDDTLGQIRVANANDPDNSGSGVVWSHELDEFYRVQLDDSYGLMFARIGWHASNAIDPDLTTGAGTVDPAFVYPVDRQIGGLIARYSSNVSLSSGTWPAGAAVRILTYVRWVLKDGTYSDLSFLTFTNEFTDVSGDWVEFNSESSITVPDDAVGMIPYTRIEFENATPEIQVDLTAMFVGQANSGVLIEDGAITANKITANAITSTKIAANAITTDKLSANSITAKHTITGALFQTGTSGNRVRISPDVNYFGQPGVRMFSGGSGARDSSLFIADSAGSGGWEPYTVVLTGSEVTRNSSGRADLELRHAGPFRIGGQFVADSRYRAIDAQGDSGNEILVAGSVPRGTAIGDFLGAYRGVTSSFQNGTITWADDNGWIYRGSVSPNSPGSTPRYSAIQATSTSSITWNTNASVDQVYLFVWRGGFII